jgi:hypothetical protein
LAIVAPEGGVRGLPKPVSVRDPAVWGRWRHRWTVPSWLPEPSVVGLIPASVWGQPHLDQLPPGPVVFPRFEAGEDAFRETISPALATALCVQNCHNLEAATELVVNGLRKLCEEATSRLRIRYSSSSTGCLLLSDSGVS